MEALWVHLLFRCSIKLIDSPNSAGVVMDAIGESCKRWD